MPLKWRVIKHLSLYLCINMLTSSPHAAILRALSVGREIKGTKSVTMNSKKGKKNQM